jgi:hypothetical protein
MCCSQLETCFGTDADAATDTPCTMLFKCVQDLEAGGDAAAGMSMSDAFDSCKGSYSATDQTNAKAILSCLGDGDAGPNLCGSACAM